MRPWPLVLLLFVALAGCADPAPPASALLLVASPSDSAVLYVHEMEVAKRATAGFGAAQLAVDPEAGRLYAASSKAATIAVLDLATAASRGTIVTQASTRPDENFPSVVALDDAGDLWVALPGADRLLRFDAATRQRESSVDVEEPLRLAASEDRMVLAVVWGGGRHLSLFDPANRTLGDTILENATALQVAPFASGFVAATAGGVVLMDGKGRVVNAFASPGTPAAIAVSGGRLLLATTEGDLHAVELGNGRVVETAPLGSPVAAMAIDPDAGRLYLALPGPQAVEVRNALTLGIFGRVPLDAEPNGLAWARLPEGAFRL